MERAFLVADKSGGCDLRDTVEQNEHSGPCSLEPDAVLEWLTGSCPPVVPTSFVVPFRPDKMSSSEQPESFLYDNTCEENHSVSMATMESDDGLPWLSSLENDSELDQQMATASPSPSPSTEFCRAEQDSVSL